MAALDARADDAAVDVTDYVDTFSRHPSSRRRLRPRRCGGLKDWINSENVSAVVRDVMGIDPRDSASCDSRSAVAAHPNALARVSLRSG